jgi:hypothetical protein
MNIPQVRQFAANHVTITTDDGMYLQSYETVVAFITNAGDMFLDPMFDCSKTTAKNVYKFLNLPRVEVLAGIKAKTILIKQLN